MSTAEEYRRLALRQRMLAQRELLPQVRGALAASADKWEFLAQAVARRGDSERLPHD